MATRLSALIAEFLAAGMSNEDSLKLAREQDALERAERTEARNKAAELELLKHRQDVEMTHAMEKELKRQEAETAQAVRKQEAEIASELMKREAELLQQKASIELQQQKLDAEIAKEKAAAEVEAAEKKATAELQQMKYAAELEIQRARLEHEKSLDMAKLEQQRIIAESESQVRIHEIDNRSRVVEERASAGGDSNHHFRKYDLGIGMFSNTDKDLEPFLTKFEVVAEAYRLPRNLWAVELAKSLTGESLALYETLSSEARLEFHAVVEALKKKFGVTNQDMPKEISAGKMFRQ
jgi:hypothetical protein